MQATVQNTSLPLQQIYQLVAKYSIEQQFIIAEYIKKQALIAKWDQFAQTMSTTEPDVTEEEIVQEIKAMRAECYDQSGFFINW